jgi:hypothetical protein
VQADPAQVQHLAVAVVEAAEVQALLGSVQPGEPGVQVTDPAVALVQGLRVPRPGHLLALAPGLGLDALAVQRRVELRQVKLFGLDRILQFQPLVIKCRRSAPRTILVDPTNPRF